MKKILTIAAFGEGINLNSMFDDAEIIAASGAEGISGFKKVKSKYTVFLNGGFTYRDLRPLLDRADKSAADIITFEGGCLFKTSVIKFTEADIFNLKVSTALCCKSIEKTTLTPFNFADDEMDCNEGAFDKLKAAIKEYAAAKTKVPVEVYSFARDMICERLVLFYKCYMLAVRMGADNEKLVGFDKEIKALDMVLYKVFENRFNHDELAKLRSKNFKISFFTANRYKKELGVK